MASFTVDDVGLLLRKLREVQYEAKRFGINLGLKNTDIEAVCKPSNHGRTPQECLQHVLSLWQKQPCEQHTWKILVQALRLSGEQVIANRIEKSYTLDQSVSAPFHDLLSLMDGINTTRWRSLGLDLGLPLSQINEFDDKGGWSEHMMIEFLSIWVRGNGRPATLDTLVTAARELQHFDLADRLAADSELHLSSHPEHSDLHLESAGSTGSNENTGEPISHNALTHGPLDMNSLLQKYNLSQANIEKPCDDDLFLILLPQISSFNDTAPYFGYTQTEIEEIQIDKPTERTRTLSMLWKWRNRNGSDATYLAIMKVLLCMSDQNLAEIVLFHIKRRLQHQPQSIDSYVYPERACSYSNWDKKSAGDKEQIKNCLFNQSQDIRTKFSFLTQNILDSFESSNVEVKRLKMFLYTYGSSPKPTHDTPFSRFESAANLVDVFLVLCRDYASWFNIQLLKAIVKQFGSEEDQKQMKIYEDELVCYLQRSIFEIPSKSFAPGHENAGLIPLFVLVPDDVRLTGNDIKNITHNLSQLLGISDGILQFIGFDDCSILLIFGVPEELLHIKALQSLIEKYFTFDATKKGYTFNDDLDLILYECSASYQPVSSGVNSYLVSSTTEAGGYDYEFVDTNLPDVFQCPICILVPRDVYQANCCGKMFCKSCLDELERTSTNYTCPNCREDLTNNCFKDSNMNRIIRHLHIYCINKKCRWEGSLQDIDNHLSKCPFQTVECSNKCGTQLDRCNLEKHILNKSQRRIVSCFLCHQKGEYTFITGIHHTHCPNVPLHCPNNGCKEIIKRHLMTQHRTVCPHEMVNLVMCSNGCGFKCKQNKLYKHLQNTCPKRIVSCEYCHKEDEYQIINGDHHYKECPDYPLYCPNNGCEKKIKRRLMTQHRNTCPKCNKKMKREDMPQHNKENVMIERYSPKISLGFISLFVVLILASTYLRIPIILLMIFALVVILTKFGNTQE